MPEFAQNFALVAADDSTTVNELAGRMATDSRFARMVLMQAYTERLVWLNDGDSLWVRAAVSNVPEVIGS